MTKEDFLSIAEDYYTDIESLKDSPDFYDYEKSLVELMQKLCCDLMEKQLNEGSVTKDRRKKKTLTRYGEIVVSKTHPYMQDRKNGFGISPYMQELIVYAGHMDCYLKSEEILEKFTCVKVDPSQVYRVTDHVSESLKGEDAGVERTLQPLSKEDVLYVEIDGSMIHTRNNTEPWKEVKLGRLFRDVDCLNPNSDISYLQDSQYVGHFGKSVDFCKKLKGVIDAYGDLKDRLVFISDGAAWIREWVTENYPTAVSILDYYHAMGYVHEFADKIFPGDSAGKDLWCDQQRDLLRSSNVESILENIASSKAKESDKRKITNYCQNNKNRMQYKQYRTIGCGIIGSGAIESAHKTVIQKRMKQSGQRWSTNGATNMLRLRVISMNKQWAKVINFLKVPQLAKCA